MTAKPAGGVPNSVGNMAFRRKGGKAAPTFGETAEAVHVIKSR